ncbi:netrin receptor UNC5B-a-like isoform X1 [Haliotis rufescens]|uniref:netrin receptor UNC5B-a-like isoform X1 n=1 Tax=Haliotis rufescens TaxID=6454 RepID=UPI00201F5C1C|nr:netrin receptor UNC5B-a-like isoform X1 [Haliotis rufescens]
MTSTELHSEVMKMTLRMQCLIVPVILLITNIPYAYQQTGKVDGGETEWGAWISRSCSATCGKGATRTTDRHRNCTNPEPKNGGRACVLHLHESKVVNCGLGECPSKGSGSALTLEKAGLYIGLICSIIAISVFLIILVVACCIWNCRKPVKGDHNAEM